VSSLRKRRREVAAAGETEGESNVVSRGKVRKPDAFPIGLAR
jgi:hypothetical protein